MNGAESLTRTLLAGGVDLCFSNPGTSEMHFVAALDRVEGMRCVLGLFEGVVTGAADGFARMAGRPAATLLHLGPGLGNGLANLHNAKKAASPVVNIVGEHASWHIKYDAPLHSDIEGIARPMSHWVKTTRRAQDTGADAAAAITAARTAPGQIATLILPGDSAWDEGGVVAKVEPPAPRAKADDKAVKDAAAALRSGEPSLLLMTGQALDEQGLELAGRIAAATSCKLLSQYANARLARGAGRVPILRLPFPVDQALAVLAPFKHIVLIGAKAPVGFFAYPGKPSELWPRDCQLHTLATLAEDAIDALARLAEELGAKRGTASLQAAKRPDLPNGPIKAESLAAAIGALLPEGAIVADESVTTGRGFYPLTAGAPPHDWLNNLGGSIGYGIPVAIGAALACPERKVIAMSGDGSAMYTIQGLWTMAREKLNILTVIWANRTYAILKGELANVGAGNPGRKALDMLDIDRPNLDFVALAKGMGVEGGRATTMEDFNRLFAAGLASKGPYLIEVII